MKKQAILFYAFMLVAFIGCDDQGVTPISSLKEKSTKTSNVSNLEVSGIPSPNFTSNRWWSYYQNVQMSKYNNSYGPDGISWTGERNMYTTSPSFIKSVFFQNRIYMLYQQSGSYYLHSSSDGLSWTIPQMIPQFKISTGSEVYKEVELAVINGELYAYQLKVSSNYIWNLTFKYENGNFSSLISSPLKGIDGTTLRMASFADLNGVKYLFFTEGTKLHYSQSTDGVSWNSSNERGVISHSGYALDAVTFNNNIYISYKKSGDALSLVRFDGINFYYYNINDFKTSSHNVPIATDGSKLVISYRAAGSDSNLVCYSYDGINWTQLKVRGLSNQRFRELVATYN